MFSEIVVGRLDDLGFFVEDVEGHIEVRYDEGSEEWWCVKHNCRLAQCRDNHNKGNHNGN